MSSRVIRASQTRFSQALFAGLPGRYDALAAILSLGQDRVWRREMIDHIEPADPDTVLDVATGPAGVALQLADRTNARIVGIDLSEDMLARGQRNVRSAKRGDRIALVRGQGEHLPFPDETFDALTFTYLLRYVADPSATILELARVVRPGGTMASLEFAVPTNPVWRLLWIFYTRVILPIGGFLLGGRAWFDVGNFLGPNITSHYEKFPVVDTVEAWRARGHQRCAGTPDEPWRRDRDVGAEGRRTTPIGVMTAETPEPSPPAFYAAPRFARRGWLADWWVLLHPPYTLWHLSYVAIGATIAPEFSEVRLIATLIAFFLAVGLAAHALDEFHSRPLRTSIPDWQLIAVSVVSLGAAVGIGVLGVREIGPGLW